MVFEEERNNIEGFEFDIHEENLRVVFFGNNKEREGTVSFYEKKI